MGAVGQVARNLAAKQPRIAGELGRVRAVLRGQVADVFAAELSVRSDADATATLAAIDVLTSWEAYHLLREDQGLSAAAAAAVITTGLRRLLGTVV
jgi:hypothetical protein